MTCLERRIETLFSKLPEQVPKSIDYPKVPLQTLLSKAAACYPEKTAIVFEEKAISYAKLEELSNKFANALVTLKVRKGDRVAVCLPNVPQFVLAFFGALKAGAIVTAISPLHKERELKYQLLDSEAQTIVTIDSLQSTFGRLTPKTKLKNIILTGSTSNKDQSLPKAENAFSFQHLISEAPKTSLNIEFNAVTDLAALQYTGGTTGTAKGAMLTHLNLLSNALAFAARIQGVEAEETFLTTLPLFHIYGLTTSMTVPISLTAKMVLIPKFEPAKVLQTIQEQKVTVFCGVPTMYQALLANPRLHELKISCLRVCISGGSALPSQVQTQFMQVTGKMLAEGYGLTEASPVTHCNLADMEFLKLGSIGLPLTDTEARIVDLETGKKTLPQGEIGELAVKGPQVMKGYWQKPEETELVLRDGWLLTGDIARIDEEGYFYITDRKKDLIKIKDFSVYPTELEDLLYEHPAVKLCAVIGKPDKITGEVLKALVVLKQGFSVSEEELKDFVNNRVASYKAIRDIEFRTDLPLSSAGKVLKRML